MSVNSVHLLGRLGADPEMKQGGNGTPIANFSLATSRKWKDSEGEQHEETQWHRCVAFGKQAETIGSYVTKGRQLWVDGEIQYRQWEGDDGQTKYMTNIKVQRFSFVGDSTSAPSQEAGEFKKAEKPVAKKEVPNLAPQGNEDIPF